MELERQGVLLEKTIRAKTEAEDAADSSPQQGREDAVGGQTSPAPTAVNDKVCDNRDSDANVPDIIKDSPEKPPRVIPEGPPPPTLRVDPPPDNDASVISGPSSLEVEDMILQLFDLVNLKNELFRRQTELMYL